MTDLTRPQSSTDLDALKKQVVVETFRSSGPGGQRKNKTETSVRLKHLPTGITVSATEHRLQSQNLKLAFERLRERLHRLSQKKRRRIPTNVPRKAVEKRIEEKRQKSFRKQLRGKIIDRPDSLGE
jgi:protein subunit release factor B